MFRVPVNYVYANNWHGDAAPSSRDTQSLREVAGPLRTPDIISSIPIPGRAPMRWWQWALFRTNGRMALLGALVLLAWWVAAGLLFA